MLMQEKTGLPNNTEVRDSGIDKLNAHDDAFILLYFFFSEKKTSCQTPSRDTVNEPSVPRPIPHSRRK